MSFRPVILAAILLVSSRVSGAVLSEYDFYLAPFSNQLTQRTVSQTLQDSRGALWFVTKEGLNKYQGQTVENYRFSSSDPKSISSNNITKVAEDKKGNIWIATLGNGLNRYDAISNGFLTFLADPNNRNSPYSNSIHSLFTSSNGVLWLGYDDSFSSFNPATGMYHHFTSESLGISKFGEVRDIAEDKTGNIWLATGNGLVRVLSSQENVTSLSAEYVKTSAETAATNRILITSENILWLSHLENGISVIDLNLGESSFLSHDEGSNSSLSSNVILDIYEDHGSNIWVATYEGLNLYSRELNTFFSRSVLIPSSTVRVQRWSCGTDRSALLKSNNVLLTFIQQPRTRHRLQ